MRKVTASHYAAILMTDPVAQSGEQATCDTAFAIMYAWRVPTAIIELFAPIRLSLPPEHREEPLDE